MSTLIIDRPTFIASRTGTCDDCGNQILPGHDISTDGDTIIHTDCNNPGTVLDTDWGTDWGAVCDTCLEPTGWFDHCDCQD